MDQYDKDREDLKKYALLAAGIYLTYRGVRSLARLYVNSVEEKAARKRQEQRRLQNGLDQSMQDVLRRVKNEETLEWAREITEELAKKNAPEKKPELP